MYAEDQLLPISALQHLVFCERQCAIIHVERLWAENRWTVEGNLLHSKAHSGKHEVTGDVRVARGLWVRSLQLGLAGQADVVEFHSPLGPERQADNDCSDIPESFDKVVPIEYKRGKPKKNDSDRVQICAQAMCLEEMLDTTINGGYLFYGKTRRRTAVDFDHSLRNVTLKTITRFRQIVDNRETPAAVRMPKCDQCSLLQLCLPDAMRFKTGAAAFTTRQLTAVTGENPPQTDEFNFLE